MSMLRKVNEFFFDVEESEQADVVGAVIFYGANVFCVVIFLFFMVRLISGNY